MQVKKPPRVIALIDTATGWGRGIVRGISAYAHNHGPWQLWIEPHGQAERLRPPRTWAGDGIVARISNHAMAHALDRLKIPVVNVSGIQLAGVNIPRVTTDLAASGRLAAEYFLSRGFRNFGYCGWSKLAHVREHCDAFGSTVAREGAVCPVFALGVRNSASVGWKQQQRRLGSWLKGLPKPVGIFTWAAQGLAVLDACSSAELQVPEQVAVLSGDDDELLYPLCFPPLSGVSHPAEQIGSQAAAMLDKLMTGARHREQLVLIQPTHIEERQSTNTLAVIDSDVAAALRFIREHASEPIQVEDVAREAATSRRVLERKFRHWLKCSPAQEIRRARLSRGLRLLVSSSMPIPAVAEAAGFGSGMYFSQVVKSETGTTPLRYRNRMRGI